MKKLISAILSIFVVAVAGAQNYPVTQNLGNTPNTLVQTNSIRAGQGIILGSFTDTAAANALPYLKNYTGAAIWCTADSSIYVRQKSSTAAFWFKIGGAGGGSTGSFWNLTGNFMAAIPAGFGIGTNSTDNLPFKTDGTTRVILPSTGLARQSGGAWTTMMFDTTNKTWGYGNGYIPTLQQVTTAGNTTTDDIEINGSGATGLSIQHPNTGKTKIIASTGVGPAVTHEATLQYATGTLAYLSDIPDAVDSIWRVAGTDSIFWSKQGNTYKIKDSAGQSTPFFFLQDYLDAAGVAANDFDDCTSAIQSMLDDIDSAGGGTIIWARGITVQLGEVTLAMAGNAGHVRILGAAGGSSVRFGRNGTNLGTYFNAWNFTSPESITLENMAFIGVGNRPGSQYDLTNNGIYLNVDRRVSVKNCQFYGIAVNSSTPGTGILVTTANSVIIENCSFNGSAAGGVSSAIALNINGIAVVRNCEFLDYQSDWVGGESFIKSPLGAYAWINVRSMLTLNGISPRSLLIEGCRFDEAVSSAIRVDGAENVEVVKCSENIGSGSGSTYKNIRNLTLRESYSGYSSSGTPKKGITIDSVDHVTIEKIRFANDIKWVHLVSSVISLNLKDNSLQGTPTYPEGIRNDANAIVSTNLDSGKVLIGSLGSIGTQNLQVTGGIGLPLLTGNGIYFGASGADPVQVYSSVAGEVKVDGDFDVLAALKANAASGTALQSAGTSIDFNGSNIVSLGKISAITSHTKYTPDPDAPDTKGILIVPTKQTGFNPSLISLRDSSNTVDHFTVKQKGYFIMKDQFADPSSPSGETGVFYIKNAKPFFMDSIGTTYDLSSAGGGTPAGNFGNLQINRNGAFATPGSDSLDYEASTGLEVKAPLTFRSASLYGTNLTVKDQAGTTRWYSFIDGNNSPVFQGPPYWRFLDGSNEYFRVEGNDASNTSASVQVRTVVSGKAGVRVDLAGSATNDALQVYNSGSTKIASIDANGGSIWSGRVQAKQGVDVASANNLTLGGDGNVFEITGTTQINLIANTNWQNGAEITLLFTSTPTVKNAQATSGSNITIVLAGGADFVASDGDLLTLVLCEIGGVQAWREKSRSVN